jgi:hypothetical protein
MHPIRVLRNPIGSWEGWMTKDEIEFVVKNWLGDVEVIDGWWFIATRFQQPFLPLVANLNQVRQYGKQVGDKLLNHISKTTSAALQGKFMQSSIINGERLVGTAFNPVYAATITSRVRLRDAEAAYENPDATLGIVVDGILADKPLALPRKWKLEYKGKCIIANHGEYDIDGRDTAVPLKQVLSEHLEDRTYPIRSARYFSLAEAIEGDCFHEACRKRPEVSSWVRKVGKRAWDKLPHVCRDLLESQYESAPLLIGEKAGALIHGELKWSVDDIAEEDN